jgi:hypothetical protein
MCIHATKVSEVGSWRGGQHYFEKKKKTFLEFQLVKKETKVMVKRGEKKQLKILP